MEKGKTSWEGLITMNQITPEKTEKVKLFLPITFWTEIVTTLDRKIETLCEVYGYGKISLGVTIKEGTVQSVSFNDDVTVRGLVEKAKMKEKEQTPAK